MNLTVLQGDWVEQLRTLRDASVHCCVTSPPYWGLRDYGVEGQLGLEKTPEEYVAKMVEGFREVRRVLRDDGTLWLNLGDSYSSILRSGRKESPGVGAKQEITQRVKTGVKWHAGDGSKFRWTLEGGQKPKDLVGIPWMVAFALRADGWYLRSDIIWHKSNPMPESVTDRPTKSHEYIFLLSKSQRYFYDAEAIKEPVLQSSLVRSATGVKFGGNKLCPDTRLQSGNLWAPKSEGANSRMQRSRDPAHEREYDGKNRSADDQSSGRRILKNAVTARDNGKPHESPFGPLRNKRTVWTVATAPYSEAHFATFPPDLIKPCILAGTSARGCCPQCGAPWERVVEKGESMWEQRKANGAPMRAGNIDGGRSLGSVEPNFSGAKLAAWKAEHPDKTTGWEPGCDCGYGKLKSCTVLDPFAGSGTTGQVALELGRKAILIELSPKYCNLIRSRTNVTPGLSL